MESCEVMSLAHNTLLFCFVDDQSVISCVTVGSTCSLRSVASEALNTICINENGVAANEDGECNT